MNLHRTIFILLLGMLTTSLAQAQLQWRLSVKLIADAAGNPPPGALINYSNEVRLANQLLDQHGRGYQFDLTEILTLTGVSQWYGVQARNGSNKAVLQAAARANPGLYALRGNALNVYVVNDSSGICSFPGTGDDIILAGGNAYRTLLLHEAGHFFNLLHTHEGEQFQNANGTACTNGCACALLVPGEQDTTLETAPDHECFATIDALALGAYGQVFTNLNADQRWRVSNTWSNVMSYHVPAGSAFLNVLTSDQLDRATDASNGPRFNVASGRTWFVGPAGGFSQLGSSVDPFSTVAGGVGMAVSGDIIQLRPGAYNEPGTYTKPVTFRVSRGNATIGPP